MSNNEKYYFYILEWSDRVIDIKEQFPLLDISSAIEIASNAGIKYPMDKVSGFPYVTTCDFMITTNSGICARTLKMTSELSKQRVIEKLEIERRYWKMQGIDWKIVTENEITQPKAKNLEWLRTDSGTHNHEDIIYDPILLNTIKNQYLETNLSIISITDTIDIEYALASGTGLLLFKYLVSTKQLSFDIGQNLHLNALRT